jgi:hypothetical protein
MICQVLVQMIRNHVMIMTPYWLHLQKTEVMWALLKFKYVPKSGYFRIK